MRRHRGQNHVDVIGTNRARRCQRNLPQRSLDRRLDVGTRRGVPVAAASSRGVRVITAVGIEGAVAASLRKQGGSASRAGGHRQLSLAAGVGRNNVPSSLLGRFGRDVEGERETLRGVGHEVAFVLLAERTAVAERPVELVAVDVADVIVRVQTEVVARHLVDGDDLRVLRDRKRVDRAGELNLEGTSRNRVGGGNVGVQSTASSHKSHVSVSFLVRGIREP